MHLSKKNKVPTIVQYNIFKTLRLSIKNNKLLFHNSVHLATLHTDHTDNVFIKRSIKQTKMVTMVSEEVEVEVEVRCNVPPNTL